MSLSPHAEQPSPRPAATSPRWGWRVILEYCGQRREDRLLPPDAEVTIGEASGSTVIVPGVGGATGLSSLVAAGRPVVPDGLELVHDGREPRGGGPLALGAGVVMRVRAHPEIVVELRRESAPLARFGSRVAWSELGRTIVYGLSVLALFGIGTAVSHPIAEVLAYGDPNGEDSPIARAMFNTVRLVEPGPRVEWGGVEPMVAMGEGEVEAEEDVEVEEPEDVDIWGSPEEGPVVIGTTEEPVEAAIAEEVPTPEPTVEPTVEPTAKPKPKPKPVSRLETATAMIATAELEPARGEPELPLAVLVGDPDTEPGLILDVLEAAPLDLEIVEEPASVTISVAEEPEPTVAHALADAAAEGPALSHVVKAGPELAKGVVIGTAGAEPEFTCEDPTQRARDNVDVVFVIDVSTTMGFMLDHVERGITEVDEKLRALGRDPRYGLIVFVDDVLVTNSGQPFADVDSLRQQFVHWRGFTASNRQVLSEATNVDWPENTLDALHAAATQFAWRPAADTVRLVIHATDDDFREAPTPQSGVRVQHSYAQTLSVLRDHEVRVASFAARIGGECECLDVEPGFFKRFRDQPSLPDGTGGAVFDIDEVAGGRLSIAAAVDATVRDSLCTRYPVLELLTGNAK